MTPLTSGELSQRFGKLLCKLCRYLPPPEMGVGFTFLGQACYADPKGGWYCSPTTRKPVWISGICHRQIQGMKHISIRCNWIEHCMHLGCAGIRLAPYTDTWICNLHKESGHTTHTDITPPHPSRPYPNTTPTPSTHSPCTNWRSVLHISHSTNSSHP